MPAEDRGEVRLVAITESEAHFGIAGVGDRDVKDAWDSSITKEEYEAADDWIVGKRPRTNASLVVGTLLDSFRRKGRAAFKDNNE
jgi:hypothetical protein